ncbi:OsmC family protein [Streptomyces sp. NPDC048751]|uniref:OsmC family protein n=1 Tax=Streptomyces sp. NPDC048751 TaxID=3365591 RepID=UPI00371F35BC
MLNGVDLRARQALAEQIREDSWEAQLNIGVAAQPTSPDRCRVRTEPMRLGSTRVARAFGIEQRCTSSAGDDCLDPVGSLLVALGASVADSVVTRLTGEGCGPALVEVEPCVEFAAGGPARLSYEVRVEGDVSVEQARRAVAAAGERGSAHRTLAEPNEIRAVVQTARDVHLTGSPVPAGTEPFTADRRRAARVMWEVGTHVLAEVDGVHAESDQPKQLFGADLAPSAQEYVLAALAAEALGYTAAAAAAPTPDGPPVSVHSSGRMDLRGPYSAQDAPAGLRNILVQLLPADPSAVGGEGAADPVAAMRRWLAEGDALRLVRDAHSIDVTLVLDGERMNDLSDSKE